jgi:hypothetical protein
VCVPVSSWGGWICTVDVCRRSLTSPRPPIPPGQEEAAHPRFIEMHTRASYALLGLTCVQWPSFLLAAFVYWEDPGASHCV